MANYYWGFIILGGLCEVFLGLLYSSTLLVKFSVEDPPIVVYSLDEVFYDFLLIAEALLLERLSEI
jgi:hypothetical protein